MFLVSILYVDIAFLVQSLVIVQCLQPIRVSRRGLLSRWTLWWLKLTEPLNTLCLTHHGCLLRSDKR